ncbi:hypothetical protein PP7435_CHR4-0365 [Komagataella phaffii CBS 7435]|uniref:Uncharacterized protein n=3 Tax=Komagataella TaxID=460517 RepID=C4R8E0_KOMPG|nr:uncharacterized protein PAS_chr4_0605 [Komagataella phaffii GS115]AAF27635.1 unknown [Komagataella pastoris]AOA65270.1 GQ67_04979T0 [Komagataella phaffii]CAH2450734.1 hypothetical protein BQ9382_C4-1895 [Komagataella phaffii CBS 7435]AOA70010.1 GQ68_04960T0 [Komagataella phaffii GS115]CAY71865.1 Putative protein of unknown function [Komagataella phaffii GS115]
MSSANIWVAASDGELAKVQNWVEKHGLSPNEKDPNGYTPIHAAAAYGHKELIRYLIEKGADINIQDQDGDTPLHHVESLEIAQLLVEEFKADPRITNSDGLTPLQFIQEEDEFPEVIEYLQSLAFDGAIKNANAAQTPSLLDSLPVPGTVGDHDIRYTLQSADSIDDDEESQKRRAEIEKIMGGDNPEEGLQAYVLNAVQEHVKNLQSEELSNDTLPEKKRRK